MISFACNIEFQSALSSFPREGSLFAPFVLTQLVILLFFHVLISHGTIDTIVECLYVL